MDGRSQNRKSLNGLTNISADDLNVGTLEVDTVKINNITLNNAVANKYVKTDSNKRLVTTTEQPVLTTTDQTIAGTKTFTSSIQGNLSGNADTAGLANQAVILQTSRNIANQSFNGSQNIDIASSNLSDGNNISLLNGVQTHTGKKTFSGGIVATDINGSGETAVFGGNISTPKTISEDVECRDIDTGSDNNLVVKRNNSTIFTTKSTGIEMATNKGIITTEFSAQATTGTFDSHHRGIRVKNGGISLLFGDITTASSSDGAVYCLFRGKSDTEYRDVHFENLGAGPSRIVLKNTEGSYYLSTNGDEFQILKASSSTQGSFTRYKIDSSGNHEFTGTVSAPNGFIGTASKASSLDTTANGIVKTINSNGSISVGTLDASDLPATISSNTTGYAEKLNTTSNGFVTTTGGNGTISVGSASSSDLSDGSSIVKTTGNQSIAGTKTFSTGIVSGDINGSGVTAVFGGNISTPKTISEDIECRDIDTASNNDLLLKRNSTTIAQLTTSGLEIVSGSLVGNTSGVHTGNVIGSCTGTSASTTGNAGSASVLQSSRLICGVNFNGSQNIDIPSTGLSDSDDLIRDTGNQTIGGTKTFSSTIQGDIAGNAATATTTATARNIAGQSFNGSADISIASTDLSDTSNICLLDNNQTITGEKTFNQQFSAITSTTTDGIRVKTRGASGLEIPVVMGFGPSTVLQEDGTMVLCSGSSTGSRRFHIRNGSTGGAFCKLSNQDGAYAITTDNNEFSVFSYDGSGTVFKINSIKNFNFYGGSLTTTSSITSGSLVTPSITSATGTIDMNDDNITTTGDISCGSVTSSDLTASKWLKSDANKKIVHTDEEPLLTTTDQSKTGSLTLNADQTTPYLLTIDNANTGIAGVKLENQTASYNVQVFDNEFRVYDNTSGEERVEIESDGMTKIPRMFGSENIAISTTRFRRMIKPSEMMSDDDSSFGRCVIFDSTNFAQNKAFGGVVLENTAPELFFFQQVPQRSRVVGFRIVVCNFSGVAVSEQLLRSDMIFPTELKDRVTLFSAGSGYFTNTDNYYTTNLDVAERTQSSTNLFPVVTIQAYNSTTNVFKGAWIEYEYV